MSAVFRRAMPGDIVFLRAGAGENLNVLQRSLGRPLAFAQPVPNRWLNLVLAGSLIVIGAALTIFPALESVKRLERRGWFAAFLDGEIAG